MKRQLVYRNIGEERKNETNEKKKKIKLKKL